MLIPLVKRKLHLIYLALAVLSMLLGGIAHVRAQEPMHTMPNGDATPPPTDARMHRTSLEEPVQNRFINLVRNVHGRMDAAITRLDNIVKRLEERMTMLESQGVNTSGALAPLSESKKKLVDAREALQMAKTNAESALMSDAPFERFSRVRTEFKVARETTRDAFILIREALAELKDATLEAKLNQPNMNKSQSETRTPNAE